jgi:competence protein ComEC
MRNWKYIFLTLFLFLSVVIIAAFQTPDKNLHIIACNVGQGDAILVTYGTTQILTDGGPDTSILNCLGKYMPFWDRNIELVILTHPDADHSTGIVSVLKNYNVGEILINPADPGTEVYRALEKEVGSQDIPAIYPVEGMKLRVGLIYLDILEPTAELLNKLTVENSSSKLAKYKISGETNLYSIVYKLSFKNFTGLFPGDIPPEVGDQLAVQQASSHVEYIKVPHHGSTNGLTENLLKAVMPNLAVISVGKNSWGFPKQVILEMLSKYNVKVLRTDQLGDIEVVTDGKGYWVK